MSRGTFVFRNPLTDPPQLGPIDLDSLPETDLPANMPLLPNIRERYGPDGSPTGEMLVLPAPPLRLGTADDGLAENVVYYSTYTPPKEIDSSRPIPMKLVGGTYLSMAGTEIGGTYESLIWEVTPPRKSVTGAIGAPHIVLRNCVLKNIGFALTPDAAEQLIRGTTVTEHPDFDNPQ